MKPENILGYSMFRSEALKLLDPKDSNSFKAFKVN